MSIKLVKTGFLDIYLGKILKNYEYLIKNKLIYNYF